MLVATYFSISSVASIGSFASALFPEIAFAESHISAGRSLLLLAEASEGEIVGRWQIGFLGPAVFLTQLGRVSTPLGAVACMMASQGLDSFSQSGLYSNHQVRRLPLHGGLLCPFRHADGYLAVGTTIYVRFTLQPRPSSGAFTEVGGMAS